MTNTGEKDDSSVWSFASESSAHGVKNILSAKRSIIIRLLWFLGVAAAAVFLGMTLYDVADTYYKYPFNTVTRTEPRREMTFPAVTFCNLNPFDKSRYLYRDELGHILTKASLLSFLAPHFNSTDYPYDIVYNTSIRTLMDDLSQPLNTFLALCMWENKWQDCSELLTLIDTRIGRCYMFNGNASSRRFINKAGTRSGLRVIFNVNQANGAVTSDMSAGLKIHLHEPHEYPDMLGDGFVVSPGQSANIGVTKTEYRFLPAPYKAFGDHEYCVDTTKPDFENKLRYSTIYSYSGCLKECTFQGVYNICRCKYISDGDYMDLPYCTVSESSNCYLPNLLDIYDKISSDNTCSCPRPCSFVRYDPMISTSTFPSLAVRKVMDKTGFLPNVESSSSDYGEFRIYFEKLLLQETRHEPQITLSSIMATVGGHMGFFLGASVLTLAEITELVMFVILKIFTNIYLKVSGTGQGENSRNVVHVKPLK